jgi:opacity protein-like surface antigen
MSMTRTAALALALVALPAVTAAEQPPPPLPPDMQLTAPVRTLPRLTIAVGVGQLFTATAAGGEKTGTFSASVDWRPLPDRLWGGRVLYGYGSIDDGTSLARSTRRTHAVSAIATRHWQATRDLYLFGGAGLGAAAIHTTHEYGSDSHSGVAIEPGWAWAAGIDFSFTKFVVRLDATGLWHQVAHDKAVGIHVGLNW